MAMSVPDSVRGLAGSLAGCPRALRRSNGGSSTIRRIPGLSDIGLFLPQRPFAVGSRLITSIVQQFGNRVFPGDDALRQAGQRRERRATADWHAAGYERRTTWRTFWLNI